MPSKAEAFSRSIDHYLNYTRMPWGRLFYQSAWNQISDYLQPQKQSVLDIGCGFGISSLEFCRRGCKVTGIDPTAEMVRIAQESADREGLAASFVTGEFLTAQLEGHYDWVFCHNVLEYVENPADFLKAISLKQNNEGMLSLIAHNPIAKVMKKAIVSKEPKAALAGISNMKEFSSVIQTDITVYPAVQLEEWLAECGYKVRGTYGIHNLYGYIADNEIKMDESWDHHMVELELELGRLHPYKDIAVFSHLIAAKK